MSSLYKSQSNQDRILDLILNKKANGYFVDIGAHDGESFSNSHFFEHKRNYNGICIEPNPEVFKKLVATRKALCLNVAISNTSGTALFRRIHGPAEMLSGLVQFTDETHKKRQDKEVNAKGGDIQDILIKTIRINDLEELKNQPLIDFLSIDTEGSEFEILKTMDFAALNISIICCEAVANRYEPIHHLLTLNKFIQYAHSGQDYFFISNQYYIKHRTRLMFLKPVIFYLQNIFKIKRLPRLLVRKIGRLFKN